MDRNERSETTAGDGGSDMSPLTLSEGIESGARAVGIDNERSGAVGRAVGRMGDNATMEAASSSECSSLRAAAKCVFA